MEREKENKRKILILAANPKGTSPSRLDEEVREINAGLERAQKRDQFELVQKWAVRPRDVQRAMLEVNPQIVHFLGHGVGEEGLVFEDETGQAKLVRGEALAALCKLFSEKLECVLLNGCYSEVQAQEIAKYVPYVIGMKQAISDKAALEFAVGFYDALGVGHPVNFAFDSGRVAIQMAGIPEHFAPVLHKKTTVPKPPFVGKNSELDPWEKHYKSVIKAITKGRLVPFLGSDINLCDRSLQGNGELEPWNPGCPYPPSGKELAAYLAQKFPPQVKTIRCPLCKQEDPQKTETKSSELPEECPLINEVIHEHAILICPRSQGKEMLTVGGERLQHLSQYAYLNDLGDFHDQLQEVKLADQPNQLHQFLATLPAIMRKKGYYPPYPLIVTTNYDSALEKAFKDADEPFDLVFYSNAIDAQEQDRFFHKKPGETPDNTEPQEILKPNEYQGFSFDKRPVILKLYGSADQIKERESVVITEEHYIEYLVARNLSNLLPAKLLAKLHSSRSNILLLGYPLGNWNQRIILHRIWQNLTSTKIGRKWWAIQSKSEPFVQKLWESYDVDFYDIPLSDYITELKRRVQDIPAKGG